MNPRYAMPLSDLLKTQSAVDPVVTGMTLDSRQVVDGDLFVATAGHAVHGLCYLDQAIDRGCSACVFEPCGAPDLRADQVALPSLPMIELSSNLGVIADRFFETPSRGLTTIGVTGTNGKSSFVHLLAQALQEVQGLCGTLGTLGYGVMGDTRPAPLTTPDVVTVHRELAAIRDRDAQTVVMEVSSHALDQNRVDSVAFDIAVFTNLSRDHLDYHGDMEAYGAAKSRLFTWPDLRFAILNADDPFSAQLCQQGASAVRQISFGLKQADVCATQLETGRAGLAFVLRSPWGEVEVNSGLVGQFNVLNLLAVAATLGALDIPIQRIGELLSQVQPVPGRMQALGARDQPLVVVDYAHTPDALEHALSALQAHCEGRLICVFGCGGDRDRGKRPLMAEVAERLADGVIVTDDNPRSENGDAIVAEILNGFVDSTLVLVERNRAHAIASALATAEQGDVVLIAGKGHENYQEIEGRRLPFDDSEIARRLLSDEATGGAV